MIAGRPVTLRRKVLNVEISYIPSTKASMITTKAPRTMKPPTTKLPTTATKPPMTTTKPPGDDANFLCVNGGCHFTDTGILIISDHIRLSIT